MFKFSDFNYKLFIIIFIILFSGSMFYSNDARAYDGPYIQGFPLPYIIESAQMICENFDEELNQCLDERSFFYVSFLVINLFLCLVLSASITYCYTKLYDYLKSNLKK